MSLCWQASGFNWVSGDYECRLVPAPKGSKPGTRHRWQPLYQDKAIGLPMCILDCRKVIWAHRQVS